MPSNLTPNIMSKSRPQHGAGVVSPAALAAAYMDWLVHLAFLPAKQLYLATEPVREWARCIESLSQDADHAWQDWPYNLTLHLAFSPGKQTYLAAEAVQEWAQLLAYASRCGVSTDRGERGT
jgi:hypothetical protein